MFGNMKEHLQQELQNIKDSGVWKEERVITELKRTNLKVDQGNYVINFCANNYLGLGDDSRLIEAAKDGLDSWGYGLSSVRFICGTQLIHKELEGKIASFLGMDDCILYASCFDANGGLFETILTKEDAVISDSLNHASIIDGIRLCKAQRYVYKHADMQDLEQQLQQAQQQRFRLIVTDGVFSMDGDIAKLDQICDLAQKYDALVMIDDCHSTGFLGKKGKGTHEYKNVEGRVDIITGTLGKALGGASGGFTAARQEVVSMLRQRSRPYLFSNSVPPPIVYSAIKVLDLISSSTELRDRLEDNTKYFRTKIVDAGFDVKPGEHPIIPIMLGDARLANQMADELLQVGIYVIGFSYPVVPKNEARIRVQISAAHTKEELDKAIDAFSKIGKKLNVI
ncbi:glycine C-acetyltransferase [Candidatus Uabimicrobium amorphum]|uniref:2-amino-3-ketobutyrate coenzyme A ligase n=1 Tax=Uabimicrobium amorphum TaxID=2596890 RepID=A0A5S9F368_UABAM|nr:glycine C-acetyltransferase [Candidatus Uabimicrobium amorphum]BBM83104.1 2-amino-3-ketobutyrate coenzyme A ligase [Candidatus Uabimicrobium amorphum]